MGLAPSGNGTSFHAGCSPDTMPRSRIRESSEASEFLRIQLREDLNSHEFSYGRRLNSHEFSYGRI
jgi:hypothetical protein